MHVGARREETGEKIQRDLLATYTSSGDQGAKEDGLLEADLCSEL